MGNSNTGEIGSGATVLWSYWYIPSKGFFFFNRSTVVLVACFVTLLAKTISSTSCQENTVTILSASHLDIDRA